MFSFAYRKTFILAPNFKGKNCIKPLLYAGRLISTNFPMKHGIFNTFFEGWVFNHFIIVNNFFQINVAHTKLYRIFVV